ncbi:MAG: hypothetical protein IPP55_08960 [Anaerolineales bacterium]|jgi:hypothetical protein|nr:hypothetical protein [Anaerolineales bacterium]
MKYLFTCLITFFIVIVLCCCIVPYTYSYSNHKKAESEYGKEFNPQRVQMGIPSIPESWEIHSINSGITWGYEQFSEAGDPPYPRYSQKRIVIVDENTIRETDFYQGSREEVRSDGDRIRDAIYVTCVYSPIDLNVECDAYYSTFEFDSDISREEAIEILNEWGIKYP